jgi:hypothetical protein
MAKSGHVAGEDICVEQECLASTNAKITKQTYTCGLVRPEGQKEPVKSSSRVKSRSSMLVASKDENFRHQSHMSHWVCDSREMPRSLAHC